MPARVRAPLIAFLAFLLLAPAASALPTPGLNGAMTEAVYGRVFPEALETNDYVSFREGLAGLALLNERHPERMEIVTLGESVGWTNLVTQAREPQPVFSVEVTNEASPLPALEKLNIVFLIAVHGNEKGAREGALRAIEDLVAGKGIAAREPDLVPLLDFQRLVFVFVNSDGWTHEEIEYRANDACYTSLTCLYEDGSNAGKPGLETQNFVRVNGAGVDLNRQYPTVGFLETTRSYRTMEQPEVRATVDYLLALPNVAAAADVHGMLNSENFFRILLKDGAKTQQEFHDQARLAEMLKARLNGNPRYTLYQDTVKAADVWGGDFAEWGATFDAIGYSASGTGGAFVTQHLGLGAPGFTIEQAYSHILVDNYYPGLGAIFNDYHIESMRDTVASFMEFVRDRADVRVKAAAASAPARIAYLATASLVTNADDDRAKYDGWFVETDVDDAYDILHNTFTVSTNDYFEDLARHYAPGALTRLDRVSSASDLAAFDTVVVAGSAARSLLGDKTQVAALRTYAEAGGRIVLTDEALQLLAPLGLVPAASVKETKAFSGYTDIVDPGHALAAGLRGIPRVTYDANPLGFAAGECPVWYVEASAFHKAGGEAVGAIALTPKGDLPVVGARPRTAGEYDDAGHSHTPGPTHMWAAEAAPGTGVNVGVLPLGAGRVFVFGALLPDPTEVNNHPYGLEGYAVSINGNRIMLNMLGLTDEAQVTPLTLEAVLAGVNDAVPLSQADTGLTVPGFGGALAGLAAGAGALAVGRRGRDV